MARIKLFTENILEEGTVTVTGDADTGYPESRLYDRSTSLFWKDTVTESKTFQIINVSGEVDLLAIERHNFSGQNMRWQYSSDAFVTDIQSGEGCQWVQSDNNQIIKELDDPIAANMDWRLIVSGELTNPKCSEIFMSGGREFRVRFDVNPEWEDQANVLWREGIGFSRSTKLSDKRRVRDYHLFLDENTDEITEFRAAMADLDDYTKPFYIKDHEDNYFMCRFLEQPREVFLTEGHVLMKFSIIEELG